MRRESEKRVTLSAAMRTTVYAVAVLVVGVGFAVPASAQGNGPGFHASVFFDGACSAAFNQIVSSPTPPAAAGPTTATCLSGTSNAAGEAAATGLRASTHQGGTFARSIGRARIQIENVVIVGPPAASIPVSINFRMRGSLASDADFGGAGVSLYMALGGGLQSTSLIDIVPGGYQNKSGVFAPLPLGFPSAVIDHQFVTPAGTAVPNQPLRLDLELMTYSGMPALVPTHSDFFTGESGVTFPFGIPVFNLPDGYTLSIPELNIVDNFLQQDVPPSMSVSPASVNFGSVPVGSPSTSLVTVTNTGGPGLHVTFVQQSPMFAPFAVASLKKNGADVVVPVALDTNETLDVEVAFTPVAPGSATGLLIVQSDAPGQGPTSVALSGDGVQVETPPSDQIAELLAFFDLSVAAGSLEGEGPGNSATGRLKALRNMIQAAADLINQSAFDQACQQLQDVLYRIDGLPRPPEFADGAAVVELRSRITDVRAALGCP